MIDIFVFAKPLPFQPYFKKCKGLTFTPDLYKCGVDIVGKEHFCVMKLLLALKYTFLMLVLNEFQLLSHLILRTI